MSEKKESKVKSFFNKFYYLPFGVFCLMVAGGGAYLYNEFSSMDASELDLGEAHPVESHIESATKEEQKREVSIPDFSDAQMRKLAEDKKSAEAQENKPSEVAQTKTAAPSTEKPKAAVSNSVAEGGAESEVSDAPAAETPAPAISDAPVEPQIIDLTDDGGSNAGE